MITVKYEDIKDIHPQEFILKLSKESKKKFKEITVNDFIEKENLSKSFIDINYTEIFTYGVYLFFNQNQEVAYVGKSKNGFYDRLMGQKNTRFKKHWGWNTILQKIAMNVHGKEYDNLTDNDLKESLEVLEDYSLILIEVQNNSVPIGRLEGLLMRASNFIWGNSLLNNSKTKLYKREVNSTIQEILS
ncbi:MAG: hypothetical protein KQH79_14060 [Bacteroidetes bacterium]|nr:hypothetical protein [Bacteroidota bacterium]